MKKIKRRKVKTKKLDATCHACPRRAVVKYDCRTCQETGGAPTSVAGCREHTSEALSAIKKHALTKHPSNLLGAMVAQLRGEDVF